MEGIVELAGKKRETENVTELIAVGLKFCFQQGTIFWGREHFWGIAQGLRDRK